MGNLRSLPLPTASARDESAHHFYCIFCGYDVYGIPELRCPECGSGFDRASILAFSSLDGSRLCGLIRGVISGSACSAACSIAALAAPLKNNSLECLALVAVATFGAVWVRRRFGDLKPPGLMDWSIYWSLATPIIIICISVLVAFPVICPLLATAFALKSWSYHRTLIVGSHSHLNLRAGLQRWIPIHNLAAFAALIVASFMAVLSWVI